LCEREGEAKKVAKKSPKDSISQLTLNIAVASFPFVLFFVSFIQTTLVFFSFLYSSICSSLNVPISSSSVNNFLQCVSIDGQIGFVYNTDVEPLHVISISKPLITPSTSLTMSNFFHRKTGLINIFKIRLFILCLIDAKKTLAKTKGKQLSKDMIGLPQADFIHAFHIGVSGMNKKNHREKLIQFYFR